MTGYFNDRKKQKLYRQWVEKSGLPPESVPADVEDEPAMPPGKWEDDDGINLFRSRRGGITLRLTLRHFLYLLYITAVLLVLTATLATILIMQSCG